MERLRQVRETIAAERDQRLGTSKAASNPQSARVPPNPAPPPPLPSSSSAGPASATAVPTPAPASIPFTVSFFFFLLLSFRFIGLESYFPFFLLRMIS